MTKYARFSEVIEVRIKRGDYVVRELPTELELAREFGASRKTARRAMQELLQKGLIVRKPYGRLAVNRDHAKVGGRLNIAFLAMAFYSTNVEQWRHAVIRAADKINALVRPLDFVHWDDPVITEALDRFDGVFLMPSSEAIPTSLLERLGCARHVVSLDDDLSQWNIPSIRLLPPRFIHMLGDHLYELGHRHIDCLNTQPEDHVIEQRMDQWLLWQRMRKVEGRLLREPVAPYKHAAPRAYDVMKRLLAGRKFKATALVCLTNQAATGAIRAMQEAGIRVGQDVSVCSMEGETQARYQWPSRTVLDAPEPDSYVGACVDWFANVTEPWVGPRLMEPHSLTLFKGESTGPAPTKR
jgi:DNA-binding transcriptional regulator YhcF (GntR family)